MPLFEQRDDLIIGKGLLFVFLFNHFANQIHNNVGGKRPSFLLVDACGKEKLQLKNPMGGTHILAGCYPAHRGLMDADVLCNIFEDKGSQEPQPFLEKFTLKCHDTLGDKKQSFLPLLDAFYKPFGLGNLFLDIVFR
jgi:hypothetical protein